MLLNPLLLLLVGYFECYKDDNMYQLGINRIIEDKKPTQTCEPIKIPMCEKGIRYKMTKMPNRFGHEKQSDAGFEVQQYVPLVELKCSEDLQFFVCSVYLPICIKGYYKPLLPCRSLCLRVKSGCESVLNRVKLKWPDNLNCNLFPDQSKPDILCMERNLTRSTSKYQDNFNDDDNDKNNNKNNNNVGNNRMDLERKKAVEMSLSNRVSLEWSMKLKYPVVCKCGCQKELLEIFEVNKAHFNKVHVLGMPNCARPCYEPSFSDNYHRQFSTFWLGIWSILCSISTFTILATFLLQPSRYRYPERPIIFMSFCYFMVSLGFLLRLVLGHKSVACDSLSPTDSSSKLLLRYGGSGPAQCTAVFILIYYFGMAAACWWMLLALTWFLAAGLKWGNEAISKYSQVYHFLAWSLPGILTILAITLSAIDGDPTVGICLIGNSNFTNLLIFIVSPMSLLLLLGTGLLISGCASLVRLRHTIKHGGTQPTSPPPPPPPPPPPSSSCQGQQSATIPLSNSSTTSGGLSANKPAALKLEKLMIRIGVFGVLYIVPAVILLACYAYELYYRDSWLQNTACECYDGRHTNRKISLPTPSHAVFMLKYLMFLGIGISSGCWVWSRKTIQSWKTKLYRLCHKSSKKSKDSKFPQSTKILNHHINYEQNNNLHHHGSFQKLNSYYPSHNFPTPTQPQQQAPQSATLPQKYYYPVSSSYLMSTSLCNDPISGVSLQAAAVPPCAPLPTPPHSSITTTTATSSSTQNDHTTQLHKQQQATQPLLNNNIHKQSILSITTNTNPSCYFSGGNSSAATHSTTQAIPSINNNNNKLLNKTSSQNSVGLTQI